ncbi:sulfite oxidase [Longimicrobium sp.]|uniref:sulfite oxidase n=1 Tax=Longimicrobium sp. TaxID=2029185 RepID=UPI003B3BAE3B
MSSTLAAAPPLLNLESPLRALAEPVTPTDDFYQRTNFLVPEIDAAAWSLSIGGAVRNPFTLDLDELRALPWHTVTMTMECAGNARSFVRPLPPGQPWNLGAVSTGTFTGVRLRDVLQRAGVDAGAVEVMFAGADAGEVSPERTVRFERSLPLEQAMHPDVLLAWEMNGEPLRPPHGYPLRLVVPGWYGVASVKWLTEIRVIETPLDAHFQTERYVYVGDPVVADGTPATAMRVRALIVQPEEGERLAAGAATTVRGTAWSGEAPVARVEVSVDGGSTWLDADLGTASSPYAAAPWSIEWTPADAGTHVLLARATDAAGNVQPMEPVWNELGYGNNAVHRLEVEVG